MTTSSPAAVRTGEPATWSSNHGESTRSRRASNGSTQPGATAHAPQSTNTIDPSGRTSRLSLRMSQWARRPGQAARSRLPSSRQRAASRRTTAGTRSSGRSGSRSTESAQPVEDLGGIDEARSGEAGGEPGRDEHPGQPLPEPVGGREEGLHLPVVTQVGVPTLDVLEQERDPAAVVVRRRGGRPTAGRCRSARAPRSRAGTAPGCRGSARCRPP